MRMRRLACVLVAVVLGLAVTALVAGCSKPPTQDAPGASVAPVRPAAKTDAGARQSIKMTGSTTILPIAEKWREAYNKAHPDVDIAVSGGGSGTGVKELIAGTTDVAMASRDMTDSEKEQAQAKGITPVEHLIGYDGVAVIVHPSNPMNEIGIEALSAVYAGEKRSWDDLGAPGLGDIQVVSRDSSSGTYEVFKQVVVELNGTDKTRDYAPEVLRESSTQAILKLVSQTPNAIGYIGLGYVDDTVKVLSVAPVGGGAAIAPTPETVLDDTYPIHRKLFLYTNGEPTGALKGFIDWAEGPEGQAIVKGLRFVPLG